MKAWTIHHYGSPDALAFEDVAKPETAANEVLVHVRAASLNPTTGATHARHDAPRAPSHRDTVVAA